MAHIAGKDDGRDGADQGEPAEEENDNKGWDDGQHHTLIARGIPVMQSSDYCLWLLLHQHHIRCLLLLCSMCIGEG